MIQPDYCKQNFNVQIPPLAVLNLQDYPGEFAALDSDTIPVFIQENILKKEKDFYPLNQYLSILPHQKFLLKE